MNGAFDWAALDAAFPWDRTRKLLDFLKPESRVLALSEEDEALLRNAGCPAERIARPAGDARPGAFDLVTAFFAPYTVEDALGPLRVGGYFLTEQTAAGTGANTLAALGAAGGIPAPFCLENERERFLEAGCRVNYCDQFFAPLAFREAGALAAYIAGRRRVFGAAAKRPEDAARAVFAAREGRVFRDAEARFLLIVQKRRQ